MHRYFICVSTLLMLGGVSHATSLDDYSRQCQAAKFDQNNPACCARKVITYAEAAKMSLGGPSDKAKAQAMLNKANELQTKNENACKVQAEIEAMMQSR